VERERMREREKEREEKGRLELLVINRRTNACEIEGG
jgi:hypothetical protein